MPPRGSTEWIRPNRVNTAATSSAPVTTSPGSCVSAASFLSATDVENIISAAVLEADQRGVAATIAVSDRLGNVLAVYAMGYNIAFGYAGLLSLGQGEDFLKLGGSQ